MVSDINSGERLVRLEGEKYNNREISFFMDDVE